MNKKELRSLYKEKRKNISPKDKLIWDDLLLIQFQKFDLTNIHTVSSYWPMEEMNEPNTHLFSRYLQFMIPDIQVAYPVSDFETGEMKIILTDENTNFHINGLRIAEPENGIEINAGEIDLVIIPMLISDRSGNRIGFGKGFYDRFLKNCSDHVVKIAFSYFDPVDKIDDVSAFDVPLNFCITPHHIYEF